MPDLEWHGDAAVDHVRRRAVRWITRACIVVARRARELLSVPGTAVRSKAGRGGRRGSRRYGAVRSKPGEPPRKQAGRLRASAAYEVDAAHLSGRVGTNVEYGKHLELGTKRGLAPRPWLRRALAESMAQITGFLSNANSEG